MNEFKEVFRAKAVGQSPLKPLEPDESFAYAVGRGLSFFPNINGNQAAFVEEDFGKTRGMKSVVGTNDGFKFGLVNANHSIGPGKPNHVLGSIRDEALVPGVGVDVMAQIDKRACAAFDIGPEEFASGGDFSDISIEILCDRDRSTFVAMTNPSSKKLEDQTIFTAEEAAAQGIRRTSWVEPQPYLYQDKFMVAELCSPIRCRGVALLPDPADKTANIFEVAAAMEKHSEPYGDVHYADPGFRGKKRYPLDAKHIHAAIDFWGRPANRAEYTKEQQDHISNEIEKAKKHFGIGDEEKSGFSSEDTPTMTSTVGSASSMLRAYDNVDPVDVTSSLDELPDDAFADTFFNPEEDCDQRKYPLYASAESYAKGQPHIGMVKAALQAHADGKMNNPSLALQRLQVAHSQLHGAKSMDDKEKLANEVASLTAKLAEVQASQEAATNAVSAKDTEIAALNDQLKALSEEKAALEKQIADRNAEEKANLRLSKLVAVEGFSVKDEEKAALLETLKSEDELAFENRVLKAQIASMEEAKLKAADAAKKADEEKAAQRKAEEEAAALIGLDIVPNGFAGKTEVKFAELI